MNETENKIFEGMLRMFGIMHIEEKIVPKLDKKNDAGLMKVLKEMKQLEMDGMRRNYEIAKKEKIDTKSLIMEMMAHVLEPKREEVEKAKRLLEGHGYEIVKHRSK